MNHFASPSFWENYEQLPDETKKQADAAFGLIKRNPRHPSLRFKRVGKYWSARITRRHRALATKIDDDFVWFWIGDHASYERLIR